MSGFLHKSHISDPTDTAEDTEMFDDKKKAKFQRKTSKVFEKQKLEEALLDVGQTLKQVRVKEVNYFDGLSVVSMRDDVLKAEAFDYTQVAVGQYLNAKIKKISETSSVILKVNSYV